MSTTTELICKAFLGLAAVTICYRKVDRGRHGMLAIYLTWLLPDKDGAEPHGPDPVGDGEAPLAKAPAGGSR